MTDLVVRLVIDGKEFTGGVADAQRRLAALGQAGQVSAAQTAAAWRTVPAQFTDIATQLQGGASPFTVLLQQGGQLKDSFGGIGPMFSQLATLITPVNVALGAAALVATVVGAAFVQGSREADEMARALVLSGNAAGTTTGQMVEMSKAVAAGVGTQGAASDALTQLAASGQVASNNLQRFADVAVRMPRSVGQSVEETVRIFTELGRSPVAASAKLNESLNYLTKSTYDQIVALQRQGKDAEAASLAQRSYADVMKERARQLDEQLGTLQRSWRGVGDAAKKAWDWMLNVGREDTVPERIASTAAKLAEAEKKLAALQDDGESRPGSTNPMEAAAAARTTALKSQADALRAALAGLRELDRFDRQAAEARAAAAAADGKAIKDAQSGATDALGNANIDRKLAMVRNASAAELDAIAGDQQRLDAIYKSGLISAEAYTAQRVALIQRETDERRAQLAFQIEQERKRPAGDQAFEVQRSTKMIALQGQLQAAVADGARRTAQVQIEGDQAVRASGIAAASAWADAWKSAHDQARALQDANADREVGLISNPQAQESARTALANERLRRQLSERNRDAQDSLWAERNPQRRAELQAQLDAQSEATDKAIDLNNRALSEKLKPQWQRNVEAWRDTNQLMADSWDNLMNGVQQRGEDAWVQFAITGKLSVRGLVQDALAEFARLEYRKFMGSVGGFSGLLGSLASFVAPVGLGGAFDYNTLGALEGRRAIGGGVNAGGLYLVGETGPELLRMGSSGGSVVPTQSVGRVLAASASGGNDGTAQALSLSFPTNIQIDARSDQAQVAQAVAAGMVQTEKRMWAALRMRGLVR